MGVVADKMFVEVTAAVPETVLQTNSLLASAYPPPEQLLTHAGQHFPLLSLIEMEVELHPDAFQTRYSDATS